MAALVKEVPADAPGRNEDCPLENEAVGSSSDEEFVLEANKGGGWSCDADPPPKTRDPWKEHFRKELTEADVATLCNGPEEFKVSNDEQFGVSC